MSALTQRYDSIHQAFFGRLDYLSGLAPLGFRIYLAYVFYYAGITKIEGIENTIWWFENTLELPAPTLMAYLAAYTEFIGALLLAVGLATRWISIPLIVTMLVAIFAVHIDHGWSAIASSSDPAVADRLGRANEILREYGNFRWLTEEGSFVILNNGVEFAVTYLLMLVSLLFTGGGRFTSADYYLSKLFPRR